MKSTKKPHTVLTFANVLIMKPWSKLPCFILHDLLLTLTSRSFPDLIAATWAEPKTSSVSKTRSFLQNVVVK
jgi:hypothetical protein